MKGRLYISLSIVVIVIAILWWLQYKQEKEFMDSLLLHQPIEVNQIVAVHLWEKGSDKRSVPTEEYLKVAEWFNQYEPNRVSEARIPPTNAQVVIDMEDGATITIHYIDAQIYVSRTDIKATAIEYVFLNDAPKLKSIK